MLTTHEKSPDADACLRICVDTGRGCGVLLTSPLAASQNFEVTSFFLSVITFDADVRSTMYSTRSPISWTSPWRYVSRCSLHA